MARIYVSSTFSDLEDYRTEVRLALRRLDHEDVAMEYYGSEDRRPLSRCLADIASCDVYVGIFAWRYGYVPKDGNPEQRSITELEWRHALAVGKPCLIFLISEDAPWPRAKMELGSISRIESLRDELMNRHNVSTFENADQLARSVTEAVARWAEKAGYPVKPQPADWSGYREEVFNRHRWVRLQVIAGASKARVPFKIPLIEVFEPQLVAFGASENDVPDEVRRYQQEIYGSRLRILDRVIPADLEISEEMDRDSAEGTEDQLLYGNPEQAVDVLGRERTQVILGGPGSGKSTLLQYAMLCVCEPGEGSVIIPPHLRREPIPFLVELRNYVLQKDVDFVSHIVRRSNDFYGVTLDVHSLDNALRENSKALVFCDGLDEVFDPDDRRRVIEQVQAFARRYPGAGIVVTSRIAGYDRVGLELAGFDHYTLMPLTIGHIRNFTEQWYQYYTLEGTERSAQGLVQRVVESPRLLDLAGNPLLLTMMAVIYKDRDLPHERWRLYERCAETLLEDWDLGKGIEDEDFKLAVAIRTAQKSEILQRVSMYMLENRQAGRELNAISYAPLQKIIADYLETKYQRSQGEAEATAVDILRHLMERTYVLAGIGDRVFGFVHRTFMEYFAACRCLAQFNAGKSDFDWLTHDIFGQHWQVPEWEEVLLLLIAMLHDQGTPISDVVEHLRRNIRAEFPFNIAFAAQCLGEVGEVDAHDKGQELLTELAEAIAKHALLSRRGDRRFVEIALGSFASLAALVTTPGAVHKAIERLNRSDTVAARTAAWQMGFALQSHEERLHYALAALNDPQEAVRRGAIAALEREWPGRPDIGPALAEVVRNDKRGRVRLNALAAMQRSWRHEPAILDAIDDRVDEEKAYTVVSRLIEFLATTWGRNPRALDLVIKLAAPKSKARGGYDQTRVITTAARAIAQGWSGDANVLAFLENRAIDEPEPAVRAGVLRAIGQGWGGDPEVLAYLKNRAINEPEPAVRAGVLRAIGQGWGGDPEVLAYLKNRAINEPEPAVRAGVLRAIGQGWGGDPEVLAFLKARALDDSPDVALPVAALRAIGQGWGGDPEVLAYLKNRAINEPEPAVRAGVLRAIGQGWGGDPEVLAFLKARALDDSPDVALPVAALRAIGQGWGGDPEVLAYLKNRAINEPELSIRTAVLEAIGQGWGDAHVLAFLKEDLFHNSEPDGRAAALHVTVRDWGRGAPVLAFLKDRAINDSDLYARTAALQAIGRDWGGDARVLATGKNRVGGGVPKPPKQASKPRAGREDRGSDQVLAFLRDRAIDDPTPLTRAAALLAIAENWGSDQILAFLKDRAINDPDSAVRAAALRAIAQRWYGKQVLAFFKDRAAHDPAQGPRSVALRAIGQR